MRLIDLPTPALLLDADTLERNLRSMQDRANAFGVKLRPHIKTHKSVVIARRQRELGASGITVSTFFEAETFAEAGFTDIMWAFPFPVPYADRAADLAQRITFRLLVDSPEATEVLRTAARKAGIRFHVLLKVDSGGRRAGVDPSSPAALDLARRLAKAPELHFDGILTHAGQSYSARSMAEIVAVAEAERSIMAGFADRLRADGIEVATVSVGSTPTMRHARTLDGVTEIRPGNYAFHDLMMCDLDVCTPADCALTVFATVISTNADRTTVITDAGALALSKDRGSTHTGKHKGYGALFRSYEAHELYAESDVCIDGLSQEHGTLRVSPDVHFRVGDRIRILEHHACLTAAQFDNYTVVRGNDVVDTWPIWRGRI